MNSFQRFVNQELDLTPMLADEEIVRLTGLLRPLSDQNLEDAAGDYMTQIAVMIREKDPHRAALMAMMIWKELYGTRDVPGTSTPPDDLLDPEGV